MLGGRRIHKHHGDHSARSPRLRLQGAPHGARGAEHATALAAQHRLAAAGVLKTMVGSLGPFILAPRRSSWEGPSMYAGVLGVRIAVEPKVPERPLFTASACACSFRMGAQVDEETNAGLDSFSKLPPRSAAAPWSTE